MRKKLLLALGALVVAAGVMLIPVGGQAHSQPNERADRLDLSAFPADKPARPLRLLFVHHSVGGQLLADPGPEVNVAESIHTSHPNGGGLRKLLQAQGYQVSEASYGSAIGERTDMFDWLPKLQKDYDALLRTKLNDEKLPGDERNQVVLLKSCYPNNRFEGEGSAPGNPAGPELTVWNAKATMSALRDELQKHPDVLFVYFTIPPTAAGYKPERLFKQVARKVLGKPSTADVFAERAGLAREFNTWVASKEGWLKDYPLKNVVVFDYYDALTGSGASNFSSFPSGDGTDSHPSSEGQKQAAAAFVPFLNRAVHRSGLFE
jgi:hypothetical protein